MKYLVLIFIFLSSIWTVYGQNGTTFNPGNNKQYQPYHSFAVPVAKPTPPGAVVPVGKISNKEQNIKDKTITGARSGIHFPKGTPGVKTVRYDLYITDSLVNYTGKTRKAIAVNGQLPAPTLAFTIGDTALIYVHNKTKEPTGVHWHGVQLPNRMDGVPFLTQMPIPPNTTYIYKFPVVQAGTYWYHSHYSLQEQIGLYGALLFNKRSETTIPTIPLVLSDWSDMKPKEIDRRLHNANEWFSVKKGAVQSYAEALQAGHLGTKFVNEWKRMKAMDVSDVYYEKFFANGQDSISFTQFKPGDKIRFRVVNGGASSYFWLNYSGGKLMVVANDGNDVKPVMVDRMIIGPSETYDVIVTIPADGQYELLATAEDRTGSASVWLGEGSRHIAKALPKLRYFAGMKMMNSMMKMNGDMEPMGMQMSLQKMDMNKVMYPEISSKQGHQMHGEMDSMDGVIEDKDGEKEHQEMEMPGMEHPAHHPAEHSTDHLADSHAHKQQGKQADKKMDHSKHEMNHNKSHDMNGMKAKEPTDSSGEATGMSPNYTCPMHPDIHSEKPGKCPKCGMDLQLADMEAETMTASNKPSTVIKTLNYNMLESLEETTLPDGPWKELKFELTGNMNRYVWTMDNKTVSESDKIRIKQGENIRIILYNNSMMRHPMHLHGHDFRLLNQFGSRSPMKNVVDILPMETDTLEFRASESGDWFFHCHILYHMMSGMGRVFTYEDSPGNPEVPHPHMAYKMLKMDDRMFHLKFENDFATNGNDGSLTYANTRWAFQGEWRLGYKAAHGYEVETHFGRYLGKMQWLFPYVGVDWRYRRHAEGEKSIFGQKNTKNDRRVVHAGIQYMLPWLVVADASVDQTGYFRVQLGREDIPLTSRLSAMFMVNTDREYMFGGKYLLTKYFSLSTHYDSDMGWGAGVTFHY